MPVEYLMWVPLVATSLVLYVTLAVGALFSIANSGWVPSSSRPVWAATVVVLPVAGAILWLAASHRHNTAGRDEARAAVRQPDGDGHTMTLGKETSDRVDATSSPSSSSPSPQDGRDSGGIQA